MTTESYPLFGTRVREAKKVLQSVPYFGKMKWQDAIFSLGEIVFMFGLFPSLFSDHKPAWATSLVTAIMLYLFLFVHRSYKLWTAFTLCSITATLWLVLFFQVI